MARANGSSTSAAGESAQVRLAIAPVGSSHALAQSVLLYADSVLRFSLDASVDYTSRRSNSELVHSLRALLDAALPEGASYDAAKRRAYIPEPTELARPAAADARAALDVTCKLFLLDLELDEPARHAREAVEQLRIATGLETIDTLIVSCPHVRFDDDQPGAAGDGDGAAAAECSDCDDPHARTAASPIDDDALTRLFAPVWRVRLPGHSRRI